MATNAICGKSGKVLVGSHEVAEVSSWDLTMERSPTPVPKFGDDQDYLICNPLSWSGSFTGNWYMDDTAGQKALQSACTGGTTVGLVLSDGSDEYSGAAYITQTAVSNPHDGIKGVTFNYQGSGTLTVPA